MLSGLSIQNVVLIDRLDMSFAPGLSVLTGETGAGKSILLDSLGLALGARADSALVRRGAAGLSVTAEFSLPDGHPVHALLAQHELEAADALLLRRSVSADGRSRAFVNDQPVSVGLLRRLGDLLVEIHGQFESHGLLNAATHRGILDAFGRIDIKAASDAFAAWREIRTRRAQAAESLAKARAEEEFLRHAVEELAALNPSPGEETDLACQRQALMHGEKLIEAMNQALGSVSGSDGAETSLRSAGRVLERVADKAQGLLDPAISALDRAAVEAAEAASLLEKASAAIDLDPRRLEAVEERLFSLRALARKHGVPVDGLADLRRRFEEQLDTLEAGTEGLERLAAEEDKARAGYIAAAKALSAARARAAKALDRGVSGELPPLKLDRARFVTRLKPLDEAEWSENGADSVSFEIATNPGAEPAPLSRVASGGELSRLMLALKVVLAGIGWVDTIVFDEVDSAIGGATAAAVGERLARLAGGMQVLVVTHSPQVAARGAQHWLVSKSDIGRDATVTSVTPLDAAARREEIARMLSGETITEQARAAADSLLRGGDA